MKHPFCLNKALLALVLFLLVRAPAAHAVCPFDPDGSGAGRLTSDGLLFVRYALGLRGQQLVTGSVQGGTTAEAVDRYITDPLNASKLDIDGDGRFTPFDAQVIARWLAGYRGPALTRGLDPLDYAIEFAERWTATEFEAFIAAGCSAHAVPPDPRLAVWDAMLARLALGTAAGVADAMQFMTGTARENLAEALAAIASELPAVVGGLGRPVARVVTDSLAEYLVSRPLSDGPSGAREIFAVIFVRSTDGRWLIDAM